MSDKNQTLYNHYDFYVHQCVEQVQRITLKCIWPLLLLNFWPIPGLFCSSISPECIIQEILYIKNISMESCFVCRILAFWLWVDQNIAMPLPSPNLRTRSYAELASVEVYMMLKPEILLFQWKIPKPSSSAPQITPRMIFMHYFLIHCRRTFLCHFANRNMQRKILVNQVDVWHHYYRNTSMSMGTQETSCLDKNTSSESMQSLCLLAILY